MSGTTQVPAFTAELVHGPFTRTVYDVITKEVVRESPHGTKILRSNSIEAREDTFNTGIMVSFPAGHSILVATDDYEQIARLGLLGTPGLVDMQEPSELLPEDVAKSKASKQGRSKEGGLGDI